MTVSNGSSSAEWARRGLQTAVLCLSRVGRRFPFVGGKKATLARVFREKGIVMTLEAQTRFDALPEQFMDFIVAPERFAVQWAEAA